MKKVCFLLIAILVSCTKEMEQNVVLLNRMQDSFQVCQSDLEQYFSEVKGIDLTKVPTTTIEPIVSGRDTVMYLVNYGDGWELLSADKRAPVVIAMCDIGKTTVDDLYSIPEQNIFLKKWEQDLSELKHMAMTVVSEDDSWISSGADTKSSDWSDWVYIGEGLFASHVVAEIDHLLSTKWGQGTPWNVSAPYTNGSMTSHCLTGCGPVAVSQVLYYLHGKIGKPSSSFATCSCNAYIPDGASFITLDNSNTSFSNPSADVWSQMPLTSTGATNAYLVSNLMIWVGYQISAIYKTNSTTSYLTSFPDVFSESNINCDTLFPCDFDTIYNQLQQREMPSILRIADADNNGGHFVVADGYKRIIDEYHKRWVRYNTQGAHEFYEVMSRTVTRDYVCINWGWNGNGDSSSGHPIWYRVGNSWTAGGHTYATFSSMVYNFS